MLFYVHKKVGFQAFINFKYYSKTAKFIDFRELRFRIKLLEFFIGSKDILLLMF